MYDKTVFTYEQSFGGLVLKSRHRRVPPSRIARWLSLLSVWGLGFYLLIGYLFVHKYPPTISEEVEVSDDDNMSSSLNLSQPEIDSRQFFPAGFPYWSLLKRIHSFDDNKGPNNTRFTVKESDLDEGVADMKRKKFGFYKSQAEYFSTTVSSNEAVELDSRFFTPGRHNFTDSFRCEQLSQLLQTFTSFSLNVSVANHWWIAHHTLLSWSFNKKLFPFESSLNIHITLTGLKLLQGYNGTTVVGKYLLDINPSSQYRVKSSPNNTVDARFIDINTGLFMEISAISKSVTPIKYLPKAAKIRESNLTAKLLFSKTNHYYTFEEIFPLQKTSLEGIRVNRPNVRKFRELIWKCCLIIFSLKATSCQS